MHLENGERIQLFKNEGLTRYGGVVFEDFNRSDISPSGRYAVLSLVRQGTLNVAGEKSRVEGRGYCPTVDVYTGCIVSMQTGEICGGQWSSDRDAWIDGNIDRASEMLNKTTMNVISLWDAFSNRGRSARIHDLIMENFGVDNILSCDPVSNKNKNIYKLIVSELNRETYTDYAKTIERRLAIRNEAFRHWIVVTDKASLYDSPDEGSKS